MGSYDGAEICELVRLFILNHLGKKFGKKKIGLYRDDGLAIIKSRSARLEDKTALKSFRTISPKNNNGSKFTRGKLSRRYFRSHYRKI